MENNNKMIEKAEIKEELKPRSFRITDATANKIKELSEQIGGNQQQVLATLIESYELQMAKTMFDAEKRDRISKFESYATLLTRLFMDSIEEGANALDVAKTEVDAMLKSKDQVIIQLQDRITGLKDELDAALQKLNPLKNSLKETEENLSNCKNDLEKTNEAYNKLLIKYEELEKQEKETKNLYDQNVKNIVQIQNELSRYKDNELTYRDNIGRLTAERNSLTAENIQLNDKVETLTANIESIKATAEAEKVLIKKMTELEAKEEARKEMDERINKYISESEERINKYKADADKFRELYYQKMGT